MTVLVVTLLFLSSLGALVVLWRRRSAALAQRIDAVTVRVTGDQQIPSTGPGRALSRLEREVRLAVAGPDAGGELARYRAAMGAITLGVVLIDTDDERIYANPFAQSFLAGRHGDALVGQAIHELASQARDDGSAEREVHIYGPPRRTLLVHAAQIAGDSHDLGVVVLIDDVTEQERLDAIRRDFVANISHELRTPIGALSLLAETLAGEDDPAVVSGLANRISAEAQRLTNTIDDLLQLTRIEHGADDDFDLVALQPIVAAAVDRVRSAAEQHGVDVGVTLPDRELVLRGNALQLTSAVFNLLDNGVKYSNPESGLVSVRARQVDDHIELVVQDSGIGIPRRDLDRIFERFYRVDRGRSRASGGTGLGLAIVRHVVANHGGRISVESVEGEGTTFTVELPVSDTGTADAPDPPSSSADRDGAPQHEEPRGDRP